ncbi:MAG: DivIVA domain-containing protein [Candidatus Krumholzibacteriia bacterium]
MRITPLDARKQEFRKAVRGYDCDEVRAFLTTLADEYETVLVDNKQLRERIMEQEDNIGEYRTMERTLRDTLMTAERLMQDTRDSAGKESELIVRDAHLKARQILEECRVRTEELRRELTNLRKEKENYLARFKSLAEAQINFIDNHRNDFKDLDQRLISMVDAVLVGVDEHAAPKPAAVRTAAARPVPEPAAAVWLEEASVAAAQPAAPAAAPPAAGPERDVWRDYQPLSGSSDQAPAPAPTPTPTPMPAAAPAADPEPELKIADTPARSDSPEANPWVAGGWGQLPGGEQPDETDEAVAALHEDAPRPQPTAPVW